MGRIDVIGLGPAGTDLISSAATSLIAEVAVQHLRTSRHPAAGAMPGASTFDSLYDEHDTFEVLYPAIVDELVASARTHTRVLYAVPGSPSVAETTVEILLGRAATDPTLEVVVHPAMSFLDLVWARLGVDPVESGVHLVDGHRFSEMVPSDGGAVLVSQCESRFTLSDIKLAVDPAPERPVVLLQRLGLPEEAVVEVAWADIDRTVDADHLTSLWIPDLPPGAGGRLERFATLMERLREQDPWKASQTHDSLKRFLLEEAHEVLDAIDAYDPDTGEGATELASELGDLLYQVVFHSTVGAEAGWFGLDDVVAAIHHKLQVRHPHIDSGDTPTLDELLADWESAKVLEHGRDSAFDGIPAGLPALLRALKLVRKASALGLSVTVPDGDDPGSRLAALAIDMARQGIDPEDSLRRSLATIEQRLRQSEA